MIDPADLQTFLAKVEGGAVAVDLFKIGSKHHQENSSTSGGNKSKHIGNFRVALDLEDCLDRFYGGYFSDWACGGQWNRAYQFVQLLASAFKNSHIEVIAFFDGTLKKNKKLAFERNDFRQRTISVLKHIRMIGTPPPKIWWVPPSGLRTVIRNALRSVNIQVIQTVSDHTMEVIEYYHDQKVDAIVGLHPDYIVANATRYFSSHDLRLSYKGALETKEFLISKMLASLSLTADHLPFVAVFLGGYILIDEVKLKMIYERLKIDCNLDFDVRIRKLAEIVRNSPTTDIEEFVKHLDLVEFEKDIKESVEYYQRRGKYAGRKNSKKRNELVKPVAINELPMPFASETNENDEIARNILKDVNNLVDEEAKKTIDESIKSEPTSATTTSRTLTTTTSSDTKSKGGNNTKPTVQPFLYTLPGEVLKTSLNRHQRGIMDARIYQLLITKEIILPQVLEDEQYREIPSVHLFYRPARQMIYAILFNLYHQKYLCSKRYNSGLGSGNSNDKKRDKNDGVQRAPDIQVAEWIWSPQNEYKKPDLVSAIALPWAVPTIQRLWFGMAFDDKQRRMRAFLTIMRSDTPLMLNRGYVPQHMLVMACVLRYIVTSPDRNILTRQELDAFLATAFSPQLPMVENTQELVLPGVHLRGVYLATLFMQGVETCSLANDACGVPLPWTMVNPWLFFDGKLFHLKLKMSTYVSTLRELCDDHIEIVLKIERFRKAILEDVEHYLLPAAHMDPMYRPGFLPQPTLPLQAFNKNAAAAAATLQSLANVANENGQLFFNLPQSQYLALPNGLITHQPRPNANVRNIRNQGNNQQRGNVQNRKGFQFKVEAIVPGTWAANGSVPPSTSRTLLYGTTGNRIGNRLSGNLAARLSLNNRGRNNVNTRLQRNQNANTMNSRNAVRGGFGTKTTSNNNRNRNRNKRKESRQKAAANKKKENKENEIIAEVAEANKIDDNIDGKTLNDEDLQNGTAVLASDLANLILKEEDSNDINPSNNNTTISLSSSSLSPAKKSEKKISFDMSTINTTCDVKSSSATINSSAEIKILERNKTINNITKQQNNGKDSVTPTILLNTQSTDSASSPPTSQVTSDIAIDSDLQVKG